MLLINETVPSIFDALVYLFAARAHRIIRTERVLIFQRVAVKWLVIELSFYQLLQMIFPATHALVNDKRSVTAD